VHGCVGVCRLHLVPSRPDLEIVVEKAAATRRQERAVRTFNLLSDGASHVAGRKTRGCSGPSAERIYNKNLIEQKVDAIDWHR